jgi:hypothetical protein
MATRKPKSVRKPKTAGPDSLRPKRVRVRAYQVGFGDCFLLSFLYDRDDAKDRHVLIDFGTAGLPKRGAAKDQMQRIADDIVEACGGKLTAVIATHRHRDHISGFATAAGGDGTGDKIRACKPDLVLQPWTEDPKAEPDATKPTRTLPGKQAFIRALGEMHAFSEAALREAEARGAQLGPRRAGELRFLGDDNLKNASAVENLRTMGRKRVYAYFGADPGLDKLLPGVTTFVLGPPTLEQSDEIRTQRAKDAAEFWHLQASTGQRAAAGGDPLFPGYERAGDPPPYARWLLPRLDSVRGDQLLEIVRALDDAMNNTSLILLFEVGGKRLLFPGDAQIENWSYALTRAKTDKSLRDRLSAVDLYKVGHHGSLNATPKSLWNLFDHRGDEHKQDRLRTVVSTMAGKHGSSARGTEVPRGKLVAELGRNSEFQTTQSVKSAKSLFIETKIDV